MYLYVEKSKGLKDLPEGLLGIFGTPIKVMDAILTKEKKLARADRDKVLSEMAQNGYYLQMPPPQENLLAEYRKSKGLDDISSPNK